MPVRIGIERFRPGSPDLDDEIRRLYHWFDAELADLSFPSIEALDQAMHERAFSITQVREDAELVVKNILEAQPHRSMKPRNGVCIPFIITSENIKREFADMLIWRV